MLVSLSVQIAMLVAFDQMPTAARVWVYTASRILGKEEIKLVSKSLSDFMATWQSHGKEVKASFQLVENRFVIIAADDSNTDISGCGIDKSIHEIQKLRKENANLRMAIDELKKTIR